jgi:hypothetical protein
MKSKLIVGDLIIDTIIKSIIFHPWLIYLVFYIIYAIGMYTVICYSPQNDAVPELIFIFIVPLLFVVITALVIATFGFGWYEDLFYKRSIYDGKTMYQREYLKSERTLAWEETQKESEQNNN